MQTTESRQLIANEASSSTLLEKLSQSKFTLPSIIAFFTIVLLVWTALDHSIPAHDAAAHSNYSSSFRHFLSHPKNWSSTSLHGVLTLMPYYPAGAWFTNGLLKIILGDTRWSEQLILAIHMISLSLAVFNLAQLLRQDRLKSMLAVVFVNCCPLFLYMQHFPLIDLPFTSAVVWLACAGLWWWQKQTWRRATVLGLVFGFACIFKQTTIFYAAPPLAVLALACLWKRQLSSFLQLVFVAACGALFLCSWVLPNYSEILFYTRSKNAYASQHLGILPIVLANFKRTFLLVLNGLSWTISFLVLAAAARLSAADRKAVWPLLAASLLGSALVIIVAYYTPPFTRYFGPLLVAICLLLGMGGANIARQSRSGQAAVLLCLAFCVSQAILLSFQPRDPLSYQQNRPINLISGVWESEMLAHLPYVPAGDVWKQKWIFDLIDTADPKRPVYLNVLSNSEPYNLGSLAFVGKVRKSKVMLTTWRGISPSYKDNFSCTDESLGYMHWIVQKTGDENASDLEAESRPNYLRVINKLKESSDFIVAGRQSLPDGTELILYRNKKWICGGAL